jgi:hypothetical protein
MYSTLESRDAINDLLKLGFTNNPSVSIDANYDGNVNNTFAFNTAVPTTPQVGRWVLNSNFAAPFTAPTGFLQPSVQLPLGLELNSE